MWTVHEIYISYRIVCSLSFSFSYDLSLCSSATSILQLGGRTCDLCIYKFFISFFFAHNFWALCAFVPFLFCVYYDYMTTIETFAWAHATTYFRQIYWGIFYNKFVIFVCIPLFISLIDLIQMTYMRLFYTVQLRLCSTTWIKTEGMGFIYLFKSVVAYSTRRIHLPCDATEWIAQKWGKLLTSCLA